MNTAHTKVDRRLVLPVLMGFFVMGFSDIVAPITSRIAADFPDNQMLVNFLPSMVFLWFLLLATPVAAAMNRRGRRITALWGYIFTIVGLMIPYLAGEQCPLTWYFIGFALLGIGNTIVQVAINPMLATIAPPDRMTNYLTAGQIFRNVSLMILAPLVTGLAALTGSWRLLLPIYAGITLISGFWLQRTAIPDASHREDSSVSFLDCFRMLRNHTVLLCTLGIATFIIIDVGVGFVSARLIDSSSSILTTSGFYACRIVGTLVGVWAMARYSEAKYLLWNMVGALILCVTLLVVQHPVIIYAGVGLLGFSVACIFAICYAWAIKAVPDAQTNAVAGLMVLAISAGMLSGPICGTLIRYMGAPRFGLLLPICGFLYLLWIALKMNKTSK